MNENMMDSICQRICPVCKKEFTVLWPLQWAYRTGEKYYCSWKCLRKMDEQKMAPNQRFTESQKLEAIKIAIYGGDPRDYLKMIGSKNPQVLWSAIRMWCKYEYPELAKKMPKNIIHKGVKK